jgi:hypothetical protein
MSRFRQRNGESRAVVEGARRSEPFAHFGELFLLLRGIEQHRFHRCR